MSNNLLYDSITAPSTDAKKISIADFNNEHLMLTGRTKNVPFDLKHSCPLHSLNHQVDPYTESHRVFHYPTELERQFSSNFSRGETAFRFCWVKCPVQPRPLRATLDFHSFEASRPHCSHEPSTHTRAFVLNANKQQSVTVSVTLRGSCGCPSVLR